MKALYVRIISAFFNAIPYKAQQSVIDRSRHYRDITNELIGRFLDEKQ